MTRKNATATATAAAIEAPETPAPVIEAPGAIEAAPEAPEAPEAPADSFRAVSAKAPGSFAIARDRDSLGYSIGSYTSRIATLLSRPGGVDTATLLRDALDITPDSAPAPALVKARKTTLSVFFSDSKRSFGTYPVSRAFVIEEDGAGNRRISPESLDKARKAVAGGILDAIREAKTETARKAVLSRFGY